MQRPDRRPPRRTLTSSPSSCLSLPSLPLHTPSKLQPLLSKGCSPIATLPSEILISILTRLTVEQLLPMQLVSRKFRHLARTVLLAKFACTTVNNSRSSNTHDSATMTTTATTSTSNIPKPTTTVPDAGDPRAISLHLFPDPHHPPARWHECQAVVLHCTAIDRLQEVMLFQPVDPSNNTLTILQPPPFTRSQYQQPRDTGRAFRNMEVETELMRRAVRICSPAIGFNFFDYSTGQRSRSAPSLLSSTTPLNPYIRSLGYNTDTDPLSRFDPTTRSPTSSNNTSMDYEHSVIGINHGGWPNLPSPDFGGGWCHWNTTGGNDCVGGSSQREMDFDEEAMLCLQSNDSRRLEDSGRKLAMVGNKSETEMNKVINDNQPTKAHRYRLFQPRRGHVRTPSRFTRYCCLHLHHNQHQHQEDKEGQGGIDVDGEEKRGTTRAGNKDWWIEYRPIPIESSVCQSCPQQDGHRCHRGSGGGVRVEFRELRVSLDWILSGFMNKA